ncbi:uncharacterized protein LOC129760812 [Uranotaenia lowii]|uniref:uncharacterized protein LOC129760812 n=1 Tax=Uranotaenia lowii TaxID=190385 RepID=UPI00247AC283|nr:uncharacterized protein LOC129760812 [Uranotaenia lowii]
MAEVGRYVRAPSVQEPVYEEYFDLGESENATETPVQGNADFAKRMNEFGQLLQSLIEKPVRSENQQPVLIDNDWGRNTEQPSPLKDGASGSIRWDLIPSNRLWEAWQTFLENFEIVASLSNMSSARRSKLLFLAMGANLQSILRAAHLKPCLNDPQCYQKFVDIIGNYFKTMTDTAAEHEAFSVMHQRVGESTVNFHARLTEKVRLCGYSPNDQDRFVRAQLLKGMVNKELVKDARTDGRATSEIVKTATRREAYDAELVSASPVINPPEALAVENTRRRKRAGPRGENREVYPKRYKRTSPLGRRSRCWRSSCRIDSVNDIRENEEKKPLHGWSEDEHEQQINAITIRDAIVEGRLSSSLALSFLIDSGADVNIIDGNDWSILKKQYLSGQAKLEPIANPDNRLLRAYATANPMTINCAFKAKVEVVGASKPVVEAEFLVVGEGRRSLLEKNAYFNVPAAYREAAERRFEEMAARGIIEKVTSAPRWISGMSAVPKGKNDFRLVVNMRAPNKAIKREYFRLSLVDEMRIKLHGAKCFTKLDLSNAFYHLELSRESRDLTTFLTETVPTLSELFWYNNIIPLPHYAQNQREALATVWAVEHFSFFLLGRHVTLRTDAQGVTFILNRSRENSKRALTRADGWALRLSPYNYDVEYIRGNDNIADPSSRLYTRHDEPFDEQHSPWEIATLESKVSGFLTESEIRTATKENDILQKVIDALETNIWAKDLIQFQRVAAELSVEDNMLVRNGCVVIPKQLQQKALDVAHSDHPMIAKMKSILRERVWWPSMNQDVQNWIESCQECATNGRPERPTPMKRKFAPKAVWDTIAIDFNGPYGKLSGISILVVVDYRSRTGPRHPEKWASISKTQTNETHHPSSPNQAKRRQENGNGETESVPTSSSSSIRVRQPTCRPTVKQPRQRRR